MTREQQAVLDTAVEWYDALGPRVSWQDATGTALADAVRRYKDVIDREREIEAEVSLELERDYWRSQ